jgi:type IV pilus assembly protein PilC
MLTYNYKVITAENKVLGGTVSALSLKKARQEISRSGNTIIYLGRQSILPSWRARLSVLFSSHRVEQINFFRHISSMMGGGVSLPDALSVLRSQTRNRYLKRALPVMITDIKNGQKLSAAMAKFPKFFPSYIVETVVVGETTGDLSLMLERVADGLERNYELSNRVVAAVAYPIIVFVVMLAVLLALLLIVLPHIEQLYKELQAPLPTVTKVVLFISVVLRHYPYAAIGVPVVIIALWYAALRNRRGRYFLHSLTLKLPLFGSLVKEFNLARFFASMHMLTKSGISLLQSVEVAKKTVGNDVFRRALDAAQPVLVHGIPLSTALESYQKLFPPQIIRVLEVGEKTGNLERSFNNIKAFNERAVNHKTQILTTLIEPIMMLIIGVLVGGLAFSVFLPIYNVSNAF